MTTPSIQSKIIKLFEWLRLICVFIGIFMAYAKPHTASLYLMLLFVLPMTGLLAIEGICFRKQSAIYKGREPSLYQLQSVYFIVAIFIVAMVALFNHAGLQTQIAIIAIPTLFFLLSSFTHLYEFFHGAPRVNLWRFVGSVLLIVFIAYALWQQHAH